MAPAPEIEQPQQEQPLLCDDGIAPDGTIGLCTDGSQVT